MKKASFLFVISWACCVLSGCSSRRVVNIDVALTTDDASITIDRIQFASASSVIGLSATSSPPQPESNGTDKHMHIIESSQGNFVIVGLSKDGKPYHSEVYQLDPSILSQIGSNSQWLKPSRVSSGEDNLHWMLMNDPKSFEALSSVEESATEMQYHVAEPLSH